MAKIYRYDLPFAPMSTLELPHGARVLSAAFKPGDSKLSVWAVVDAANPVQQRRFCCINTGDDMPAEPDHWRFLHTFVGAGGGHVTIFHVFVEEVLLA